MLRRILMLGGNGLVGSHIVRLLGTRSPLEFLIAGRDGHAAGLFVEYLLEEGTPARTVDLAGGLDAILVRERPVLLIDASGATGAEHVTARACIAAGVAYLDVSDERRTVLAIRGLNAAAVAAGVPVLSGAGVMPCLTMAAVESLAVRLPEIAAVRVMLRRGSQEEYGPASIRCLLARAGAPMRWRRRGGWEVVRCLQTRAPNARLRHGQAVMLAYDGPETELLLELWPDLEEATVWAGVEMPLLGWGLRMVGWAPRLWRSVRLVEWAGVLDTFARSLRQFGRGRTSVRVEVEGGLRGHAVLLSWTLTASEDDGVWLRAAPAAAAARQVLQGTLPPGARVARLDLAAVLVELRGRDIQLTRGDMDR